MRGGGRVEREVSREERGDNSEIYRSLLQGSFVKETCNLKRRRKRQTEERTER